MKSAIQDRSIYEDAYIFARNLYERGDMEERDYKCYLELYHSVCQFLTPPDLIVYLRKSLPVLKQRIAMRGRDFEKDIPDEYLANLNRYYDDWMEHYDLGKKLIINSEYLVQAILDTLEQRDLFLESKAYSTPCLV
jgi:deoxyadenosine/deoxycytidine kinase